MLAIIIVDDLQWDDVDTENVSMSKQVISGDTHTQGHYDVIQNTICPTTSGTFPYVTTTDISERAVSTQ